MEGAALLTKLLSLSHITKQYLLGDHMVCGLCDVSLTVHRGEFLAVIGHSGSGKSTLLNILGALDLPTSGEYRFYSQEFGEVILNQLSDQQLSRLRNQEIGFVFQSFNLIPTMTALENAELPLLYRGLPASQRNQRACAALDAVGLSKRIHHFPCQLSGGQQQRVAIARAVASNPPLLLADEPTGNLDLQSTETVISLFQDLHRQGKTIILITHDPAIAQLADRVVEIKDGYLVEEGSELK